MSEPTPATSPDGSSVPRTLLVWDAPNMDMALTTILGRQPQGQERPRFDAVGRWLVGLADRDGSEPEACVFANVPDGGAGRMAGWVKTLRSFGYAVFVKPKRADSDVDSDMLDHIEVRASEGGGLARLVIASGDGRAFREPLEELAREGVDVTVLAFAEEATYALTSPVLGFTDLEDVPDAFLTSLPRTRLDALPVEGRWLPPLAPLRRLAAS